MCLPSPGPFGSTLAKAHKYTHTHTSTHTRSSVCALCTRGSQLKHNVLQPLAAGGLLLTAVLQERVDLPHGRLTVLPLRLPQQAVVGYALCVPAFQRVVGGGWFGLGALQVHWGGDGADGLPAVSGLAHGAVGLGAADGRLCHLPPAPLFGPLLIHPVFAKGGKSPFDGATVLVVRYVHGGGLDGQSDDIADVFGRLRSRWHRNPGHPAAVRVAQDTTFILAVETLGLICTERERESKS